MISQSIMFKFWGNPAILVSWFFGIQRLGNFSRCELLSRQFHWSSRPSPQPMMLDDVQTNQSGKVCMHCLRGFQVKWSVVIFIEGSLEVKLPTIWTDEKQSRGEAERRGRLEERRVRRKKMQMREKVGKSRNTVFFQWFVAPEGRKVGSLKRRVRSQLARWEMKSCTPLWREARFQVKMYKTHHSRTTFGSWDVEKVHPVVARSTFPSQNVQNTPALDHFWKLRCRKSACCCGAKHISKSRVPKTDGYGALLDVQMSFCVAGTGDCAPCQNWAKSQGFVEFSTTTTTTRHCSTLHYTTLHYIALHSATLQPQLQTTTTTTLHYTTLITLHYATLH